MCYACVCVELDTAKLRITELEHSDRVNGDTVLKLEESLKTAKKDLDDLHARFWAEQLAVKVARAETEESKLKVTQLECEKKIAERAAESYNKEWQAAKVQVEDLKRSDCTRQWHGERDARIAAEKLLVEARGTLEEALTGVVLTISFLGRDTGTDRMEKTASDLIAEAAKLDPKIRAVIAKLPKGGV
jgi:hypothetical protein